MTNNTTADTTASGAGEGGVDHAGAMRWLHAQCDDESANERFREVRHLIDTLRAQLEAAEADAARYRFLKTWGRQVHVISTEECNFGVSTPTWRGPWLDLDAAIDAAKAVLP